MLLWMTGLGVDLGYLPEFVTDEDERPARAQIGERYVGGWQPMDGFECDPVSGWLKFPGDPVMKPLAMARLRDEVIWFYEYGWVCVMEPDCSFEVARLD